MKIKPVLLTPKVPIGGVMERPSAPFMHCGVDMGEDKGDFEEILKIKMQNEITMPDFKEMKK